jgi:PfaD family protein
VFAKVSRPEVAARFLAPAPADLREACVARGWLTPEEAALAATLPVAEDLTVEADSGGHTDNRPLVSLFPILRAQRDEAAAKWGRAIRIGAAGGLGTPDAVAAAFLLGADYVLTGSVNQAAVESGLAPIGREMLCAAGVADVIMAPAADMFEMGVQVQVLRRGTMFGPRAAMLYDAYKNHAGLDALPDALRARLESEIFRRPLSEIVKETESFWARRDPRENAKAAADPKHRMALAFRWYLGLSSRWAIAGDADRRMDFQIWCGPAQGAFNDWVKGSPLEPPEARTVAQIARNLMLGAAVATRTAQLRAMGLAVPSFRLVPRNLG